MTSIARTGLLCCCLLFLDVGWRSYAQPAPKPPEPAQQQPTPRQAAAQQPTPQPIQQETTRTSSARSEDQFDSSDGVFSVNVFYWPGRTNPVMQTGHGASSGANPANLNYPGKSKPSPGVVVSVPAGGYNTLRISAFQTKGHGGTVANQDLTFFGTSFSPRDVLNVPYTLRNVKLSLDYLSWPFPVNNARFRLKTLWEAQYTTIRTTVAAPLKPTTDSAGNPVDTTGSGSNWFIYPSFGLGIEYLVSRHFRLEAKGSGFAVPHYASIGDAEAFGAYRHRRFEVLAGAKVFHFKTSPKREQYVRATLPGVYVGVRWYP